MKIMKLLLVTCVVIALLQHAQAFKVVTLHKGAPAPVANGPAVDPAALLQGFQSAILSKLQQVQTLVGSLIQQKTALKQNALNSIQSTLNGIKSQVASLAGNVHPPFVVRKHIYIGGGKPAPATPDSTATIDVDADADATTTSA